MKPPIYPLTLRRPPRVDIQRVVADLREAKDRGQYPESMAEIIRGCGYRGAGSTTKKRLKDGILLGGLPLPGSGRRKR